LIVAVAMFYDRVNAVYYKLLKPLRACISHVAVTRLMGNLSLKTLKGKRFNKSKLIPEYVGKC